MNTKLYTDVVERLEDEIKSLIKKESLSPQELCNLKEALASVDHCLNIVGDLPENDQMRQSYGVANGYSGNSWTITPGYKRHYYDDPYMHDSYGRGRSPITGRYVSHGMDHGYSGHSVEDRMIAQLENMMDQTNSEYERKVIQEQIHKMKADR